MNFPRPLLIQTLFEGLGANKAKVRTGAGIKDIEITKNGVRVLLTDGSFEDGSIVVGADGVHSKTRAIMQKLAEKAGEGFMEEEDPIVSNYQIMVCINPRITCLSLLLSCANSEAQYSIFLIWSTISRS